MSSIQITLDPQTPQDPLMELSELLEQGADEDGMGEAGPVEALAGPARAERRRVQKGKSRGRH